MYRIKNAGVSVILAITSGVKLIINVTCTEATKLNVEMVTK